VNHALGTDAGGGMAGVAFRAWMEPEPHVSTPAWAALGGSPSDRGARGRAGVVNPGP
jgi:hypothetical protein